MSRHALSGGDGEEGELAMRPGGLVGGEVASIDTGAQYISGAAGRRGKRTEQDATAVFQTRAGATPDEIRTAVALRQHRQRLLTRVAPTAPELDVLIDEAVLYRPIADCEAFRMQLAHLVNVRQVWNQLERLALSAGATDDLLAQVIKESYDEV